MNRVKRAGKVVQDEHVQFLRPWGRLNRTGQIPVNPDGLRPEADTRLASTMASALGVKHRRMGSSKECWQKAGVAWPHGLVR